MTAHDPRLHAYRADLADLRLRGKVAALRFVEGRPARIGAPLAAMRGRPDRDAPQVSELQFGDDVLVFDEAGGFAWVQAAHDGYVGYVETGAVGPRETEPTHAVAVPRTFLYPAADMKLPHRGVLSMGARVAVTGASETRGSGYLALGDHGFAIARHLRPLAETAPDYVAIAEMLLHTPYLWGGATGFGIDCSGLVQLSMRMAGRAVLRDSDMQAATIGDPLDPAGSDLRRGDLVFWKGHVAIMADAETMIHASGHTMLVSRERLADAVDRIAPLYGQPTGFRRPASAQ